VVLVTSNFRYLASAPAPRRYAGGQEPELSPGQGPKPPPQLAHTTASLLEGGEEGRELLGAPVVLRVFLNCGPRLTLFRQGRSTTADSAAAPPPSTRPLRRRTTQGVAQALQTACPCGASVGAAGRCLCRAGPAAAIKEATAPHSPPSWRWSPPLAFCPPSSCTTGAEPPQPYQLKSRLG
jgi:hypothetical protein